MMLPATAARPCVDRRGESKVGFPIRTASGRRFPPKGPRMSTTAMKLSDLAQHLGGTLKIDDGTGGDSIITACAPIQSADRGQLAFVANRKYARFLATTKAAAVLVDEATAELCPPALPRIICEDPYFAFRTALIALHGFRRHPEPHDGVRSSAGAVISARASVHPDAVVEADALVHPFAAVERGAHVGRGTVLYPGSFVGPGARIGTECVLFPGAVVYDRCVLGNRVTLHANTVVGQDGFGYATHKGAHHKIPQSGIVVIEDDVELGAACAIERAAIGETRIGQGTKFADLISIGHGTRIGKHCLFVSFVGVSGSVDVGNYVVLGGQVGVAGHLTIGDGVQAAGRSAIAADIEPGRKVGGVPAIDLMTSNRNAMAGRELAEMLKRIKALEREVAALRGDQV